MWKSILGRRGSASGPRALFFDQPRGCWMRGWDGQGKAGLTTASCPPWRMLLGVRSKHELPAVPHRDVNVTLALTWQSPLCLHWHLSRQISCSPEWYGGAGRCPGQVSPGGPAGTRGSPHLAPVPASAQPLFLFTRCGILVALKNVFANSFALTSRFSHLPSPAAPAGQGLREHPAPEGSSPWLVPGLPRAFSPPSLAPLSPAQLRARWK